MNWFFVYFFIKYKTSDNNEWKDEGMFKNWKMNGIEEKVIEILLY